MRPPPPHRDPLMAPYGRYSGPRPTPRYTYSANIYRKRSMSLKLQYSVLVCLYSTLLQRRRQFYPSYATMDVSSIIRAISNDTSWFEGPVPSYNSWVEVLIDGWHMWGMTGDLLQKFTMHWAFWCQKHAIPYTLIRQIPVATIEIRYCRTLIYIPMMNNVARLSVIFSLTTTTNHFPFHQISEKSSILDGMIIHAINVASIKSATQSLAHMILKTALLIYLFICVSNQII